MIKNSELKSNSKVGFLNRSCKTMLSLAAVLILTESAHAAAIADFGTTAPTPGPNDISQLVNNGDSARDGLNYFADNSSPPGQTFTTGSNPSGYALTSLYVQTGGYNANNTGTAQSYTLRIYSISGGNATLISTYVTDNLLGFTDGAWLKYTGLTNILQPNTVYAYTHALNTVGWDGMACATGNLYAGGQICLIPTTGGAVVYGSTGNSDAAFLANLVPITDPFVFPTYINRPSAINGNSVVISAGVGSGTQPIYYQWLFTDTNGVTTKIPGANSISYTIASVQATNAGIYSLMVSNNPGGVPKVITNTPASLAVRSAYTIATIGTTAPSSGPYDIAQLTPGTDLDGLNYFSDNSTPPGQTFTTGNNPSGYTLTAIYLKTAGVNSSGTGTAKTYTLRLYSISGSTATLISTYLSDNTVGFTDGDWLRYTGMTNVLQPNTVYAYSHRQNGSGYDQISAVSNNPSAYAGGEACLIPQAGGTITTGTSHNLDAAFQVSMVPNGFPAIQNVTIATGSSPGGNALSVYAPAPATLAVQASGATPLHYDWQTDNGSGGVTWTDLPNSNTNSYDLDTTSMAAGTYLYQVIVTNVNSMATSSVVQLNLSAASAPILVTDTVINPAATFVGNGVTMSAAFTGSPTIAYQWMFNNGNGAVAIAGATNTTYSIASAQLTNGGSYYLTASNGVSPFMSNSTPMNLLVGSIAQNNSTSASMVDAGSSAPTPGTYDISQLVLSVPTAVDGINYYVDSANPPGQTFTTLGSAPNGYLLSSIFIQDELSSFGGDATNPVVYTLGIYSVSGSNAVLLTSYSSTNLPYITNQPSADPSAIVDGDWIKWTGLTNILNTNSTYAFSIHKTAGHGWWRPGNDWGSGDLYSGGQVASLPGGGIGAMAFSTDTTIDAAFLVALSPASAVVTPPHIGTAMISSGDFMLSGSGGTSGGGYTVLSQTNLAQPLANWTVVGTGTFDSSGNFSFTNGVTAGTSRKFYRIRVP
jgi:hypothetical protein